MREKIGSRCRGIHAIIGCVKNTTQKPRVPTGFEHEMRPRCCRDFHVRKERRTTCRLLPCLLLAAPVILLLVLLILYAEGVIG